MARYVLKRLLWLIPVIIGVTVFIFTIMFLVPGDPAKIILGSDATAVQIDELRQEMGLNDPFMVQLVRYLKQVFFHFDFGTSYISGVRITDELMVRLPRSVTLGLASMILSMAVGIPLGILAAINRNGPLDRICMIVALLGVSIPGFWMALMLVLLFSVRLKLLPATGIGGIEYYILPCIAQAIGGVGGQARQARSSMLEVIRSDYVTTARSKGLSEREVIIKHALPNALIPIVTMAGGMLANIFGGSVIIENVFSIPGVGQYMINAVNNRDYPVVQASCIFLAIVFCLVMLIIDISYGFIDPRIKAQYERANKKRKKVTSNG